MVKFLGGVVVGIFVGALTVEVVSRRYPDLVDKVEAKGRRAADFASDVWRRRVAQPVEPY